MRSIKITINSILLLFLGLISSTTFAENALDFGNYVVHYNAFRSDTLTPEIAKAYSLTRRNNRMVVNITVQKREGTATLPVKASVTGFASNLSSQVKNLTFREIHDGDAIYYLAQEQVSHKETLKFDIKVTPEGETLTARVKFKQQFFTD
ncbi:MAG: DUF4426 domain-containing protein [Gammaproteobacteria bacterium]|nr:DUF4426 domain-containing protein [Gammaproteobacteria bacterium]